MSDRLYGMLARFDSDEKLVAAARAARAEGYRRLDAFSPIPIEGLAEALGLGRNWMPLLVLLGGLAGAAVGFGMLTIATVFDYPYNVGGRPLFAWPAYIPITFELTILFAALTAFVGVWWLSGLPQPYHPIFGAPGFELASRTRFFLLIKADDPRFEPGATRAFLEGLSAEQVEEVHP